MNRLFLLVLCTILPWVSAAQESATVKLRLRALLHDPLKPYAEFYFRGPKGMERLNLAMEGLTESQDIPIQKGVLNLFSSARFDPKTPMEHLAATVKVPASTRRGIGFIVPAPAGGEVPYRLLLVDDSPKAFPKGETRVLNLTALELAIKAGEHSVKLPPAAITALPKVAKRNDLNQAPTELYQKMNEDWVLVAERPMQFTDVVRNIMLTYQMPNVAEPQIRTLIDTEDPSKSASTP